jgi:hypothetical protein
MFKHYIPKVDIKYLPNKLGQLLRAIVRKNSVVDYSM